MTDPRNLTRGHNGQQCRLTAIGDPPRRTNGTAVQAVHETTSDHATNPVGHVAVALTNLDRDDLANAARSLDGLLSGDVPYIARPVLAALSATILDELAARNGDPLQPPGKRGPFGSDATVEVAP